MPHWYGHWLADDLIRKGKRPRPPSPVPVGAAPGPIVDESTHDRIVNPDGSITWHKKPEPPLDLWEQARRFLAGIPPVAEAAGRGIGALASRPLAETLFDVGKGFAEPFIEGARRTPAERAAFFAEREGLPQRPVHEFALESLGQFAGAPGWRLLQPGARAAAGPAARNVAAEALTRAPGRRLPQLGLRAAGIKQAPAGAARRAVEAGGGRLIPQWRVTIQREARLKGRAAPEPWETEFTITARTQREAAKKVEQGNFGGKTIKIERLDTAPKPVAPATPAFAGESSGLPYDRWSTTDQAEAFGLAEKVAAHPAFSQLKRLVDVQSLRNRGGKIRNPDFIAYEPKAERVWSYLSADPTPMGAKARSPAIVALQDKIAKDVGVGLRRDIGKFKGVTLDIPQQTTTPPAAPLSATPAGVKPFASPDDISSERARAAFRWTSQVPEERATQVQNEFARYLNNLNGEFAAAVAPERRGALGEALENFKAGYKSRYEAWLDAKSRTASVMVTGRSKFNVARNDKANAIETKRSQELNDFSRQGELRLRRDFHVAEPISPEQQATNANKIQSIDDLNVGDRVFTIMGQKYGTVEKKFKATVRLKYDQPLYGNVTSSTENLGALQRLSYDDLELQRAGVKPPAAVAPRPAAAARKEPWQMTKAEFVDKFWFHGKPRNHPSYGQDKITGGISQDWGGTAKAYATSRGDIQLIRYENLPRIARARIAAMTQNEPLLRGNASLGQSPIRPPQIQGVGGISAKAEYTIPATVADPHRFLVEKAISEGKPVPANILAEYPDLVSKAPVGAETRAGARPPVAVSPPATQGKQIWEQGKQIWDAFSKFISSPAEAARALTDADRNAALAYGRAQVVLPSTRDKQFLAALERTTPITPTPAAQALRPAAEVAPATPAGTAAPSPWERLSDVERAAIQRDVAPRGRRGAAMPLSPEDPVVAQLRALSPTAKADAIVAKEPWAMTRDEYFANYVAQSPYVQADIRAGRDVRHGMETVRKFEVDQAVEQGKPVPPEVLADYPDLVKTAPTGAAARANMAQERLARLEAKAREAISSPPVSGLPTKATLPVRQGDGAGQPAQPLTTQPAAAGRITAEAQAAPPPPPQAPVSQTGGPPPLPPQTATGAPPPPEDIGGRIADAIKQAKAQRPRAKAEVKAGRAKQAAKLSKAQSEATTGEEALRAQGVMAGRIISKLEGGLELSGDDMTRAWEQIRGHTNLSGFQKNTTLHALQKLTFGELPQPAELDLLGRVFGKDLVDQLNALQKSKGAIGLLDVLNLPRTVKASWDFSAPLRQGFLLSVGHPIAWAKSFKPMFKAWGDEEFSQAFYKKMLEAPEMAEAIQSKLYIAPIDDLAGKLSVREEQFMSRFARKIPGIRRSERAYITFLNSLRFDVFKSTLNSPAFRGAARGDINQLAHYVNIATGRGDLPFAGELGAWINSGFFAPRYAISRFQYPVEVLRAMKNERLRGMVAKDAIAAIGTGVGLLSLAKLSGVADVEIDSRSSDYGKIRVGNTRYDFWAGEQQVARYLSQFTTGTRKLTEGGKVVKTPRLYTLFRFGWSKTSPIPSLGISLLHGTGFTGEKVEPTWEVAGESAVNLFAPIGISDLVDAAHEMGIVPGVLMASPAVFGAGVQTYRPRPIQRRGIPASPALAPAPRPRRGIPDLVGVGQ